MTFYGCHFTFDARARDGTLTLLFQLWRRLRVRQGGVKKPLDIIKCHSNTNTPFAFLPRRHVNVNILENR